MNLLDNILYSKKHITGLIIMLALFLCACDDKNEIGLPIDTVGTIDALTIDLPIKSSMVLIDSISTKNRGRILVGSYQDPDFGTVSTTAFTQLGLQAVPTSTLIPDDATITNAIIQLSVNYNFGTEAISTHPLSIYPLDEAIDSARNYFFSDQTAFVSEVVVDSTLFYDIADGDTLYRLDVQQAFAADLFNSIKAIDTDANNTIALAQKALNESVNGLAITQDETLGNVLGVETNPLNTKLSLIYSTESADSLVFDLFFTQIGFEASVDSYSNISVDRTGTGLAGLVQSYTDYPSTDGNIYSQFATGIVPKFDISSYDDFLTTIDGRLLIVKAEIIIETTDAADNISAPGSLFFPITNELNLLLDPNPDVEGGKINASTASPVFPRAIREEFFYTNYYQTNSTFDPLEASSNFTVPLSDDANYNLQLGLYLQLIADGIIENDNILVYSNFFNQSQSLERLVVPEDNLKLKLYYTILK